MKNRNQAPKEKSPTEKPSQESIAKKSVRISGERLIASLTAAAKRDNRTLTNFVLRLVEKAQPYWEKDAWDKNYFNSNLGPAGGVSLPFSASPRWLNLN
jgi:hypothetical protein